MEALPMKFYNNADTKVRLGDNLWGEENSESERREYADNTIFSMAQEK